MPLFITTFQKAVIIMMTNISGIKNTLDKLRKINGIV